MSNNNSPINSNHFLENSLSKQFYEVIFKRRDVRSQFNGEPIPEESLRRILEAAHAAPSVGLSQPWDFILVTDVETKTNFQSHVSQERKYFADSLTEQESKIFEKIKIEGILESSLSIVVTYDPTRGAPNVLGRHAIADAGLYSVCLAIQNLWLAATAENLGLGWVSFYKEQFLQNLLSIPKTIRPVAWLCLGPVTHVEQTPDLERQGWKKRRGLEEFIHYEQWSL